MNNLSSKADTIYALSTVFGKSAIAIIRLSGPHCRDVIKALFGSSESEKTLPRRARFVELKAPNSGEVLDKCIYLFFSAPHSFTGEDMLELNLHGSTAVIRDVMAELAQLPYLRMAEPGEFSKLAFLNGKMDLTAIEGLGELIDAETSGQRRVAIAQVSGQLRDLYNIWRDKLLQILAPLEAHLNFPDEAIPEAVIDEAIAEGISLHKLIQTTLLQSEVQQQLLYGLKTAIIGVPNAGKSSLLNLLTRQDLAIVSPVAGTTRDIMRAQIELNGQAILLFDTAGIRQSSDPIESEGIRRARQIAANAHVIICIIDAGEYGTLEPIAAQIQEVSAEIITHHQSSNEAILIVIANKLDLWPNWQSNYIEEDKFSEFLKQDQFYADLQRQIKDSLSKILAHNAIENLMIAPLSASCNAGTTGFTHKFGQIIKNKAIDFDINSAIITNMRQKALLQQCLTYLEEFLHNATAQLPLDITVFPVYSAVGSLEEMIGTLNSEAILDRLFSSFCIGK